VAAGAGMTRPKDDAYPNWYTEDQHGETGLSKLEYFAAAALQGILANRGYVFLSPEERADSAVRAARALVEALNTPEGVA
jgi:hypothetical protein